MINAIGRELPENVYGYGRVIPFAGAFAARPTTRRHVPPVKIAALAVLSMTYGNLTALVQDNVVRLLLAYYSIAQSGYFLLGVVAFGQSDLATPSLVVFAAAYVA
jgi:NADH-quinone oxidoreductase subunit N